MAIQDVIERIADKVEAISGIKGASDYLPEQLPSVENWVVIYPGETRFVGGSPSGYMTALYSVIVELHTPRKVLPKSIKKVIAYFDSIPNALYDDLYDTKLGGTASTFGDIVSTGLISMNYAGIDTIGFKYTINGVKIQTAVA